MPIFNGKVLTKFNGAVLVTVLVCLMPLLAPVIGIKAQNKAAVKSRSIMSYIRLSTDEKVSDKLVAEKLEEAGIKNVLSESSQWFFLNDFSELRRIPLDQFSDFLLETDPRNDGYAQRLRYIFVRDGRRYFYIPSSSIRSSNPTVIEQLISGALEDTPYSLAVSNTYSVDGANYVFIFILAGLLSLVISAFVSKSLFEDAGKGRLIPEFTLVTAALLPACSLFAWQGAAGFALAAVALSLFITLWEPVKSFFIWLRLAGGFAVSPVLRVKQSLLKEKKIFIFMCILFVVICITGGINIIYTLPAMLFCCLISAACGGVATMPRGGNHLRFVPVDIRPRRQKRRRMMFVALPFTLASIAALGIPFVTRVKPQIPRYLRLLASDKSVPAIGADDYERHLDFQKNFSFRKLGGLIDAGNQDSAYVSFETGSDGLLYPAANDPPVEAAINGGASGIPPFPLEKLISFLNGEDGEEVVPQDLGIGSLIAVILAASLYIPAYGFAVYGNGKKGSNTLYISQSVTV
jgi:hypothetical protein